MATYEVQFATSAAKEFRSLVPELKHRIGATIDGLNEDPRLPGVRKLVGHERLYRIRVGQYRVVLRLTTRSSSFVSHAFGTGGKFTDKPGRRVTRHGRASPPIAALLVCEGEGVQGVICQWSDLVGERQQQLGLRRSR